MGLYPFSPDCLFVCLFVYAPYLPCFVSLQAIVPFIDYAGFILISCILGCKKELKILQNNALRICLRYIKMVDHVSIDRLHAEANLQNLEQHRILQLLPLLCDCSNFLFFLSNHVLSNVEFCSYSKYYMIVVINFGLPGEVHLEE